MFKIIFGCLIALAIWTVVAMLYGNLMEQAWFWKMWRGITQHKCKCCGSYGHDILHCPRAGKIE
jgi:hypothetical protein